MEHAVVITSMVGVVLASLLIMAIRNLIKRHMAKRRALLAHKKLLECYKRAEGPGAGKPEHPSRFHY